MTTAPKQQQTAARYAASLGDLSNADLSNADLSNADLLDDDLSNADRDRRQQLMADSSTDEAKEFAASRAEDSKAQLQISAAVRDSRVVNRLRLLADQPQWMPTT